MSRSLLLDLQACQTPGSRQRGIGRYVWHLFEGLWPLLQPRYRIGVLCSAYYPVPRHGWLQSALARGEAELELLEGLELGHEPETRRRNRLRYDALVRRYDALLIGSPFEFADGVVVPDSRDGLERLTIFAVLYDLIPLIFAERYLTDAPHAADYYRRLQLLREADGLLAISEATRMDAIRRLDVAEGRVTNIFGGVGANFSPLLPEEEGAAAQTRSQCGLERPFLLYTGGDDWRKNISGLIDAYASLPASLRDAHQLAIVCRLSAEALDTYRTQQRRQGLPGDAVRFPGFISDDALRHLCATCVGLVFPSFYEGFGLPVAEVLACGRPAIVADAASLPELVPDPAARFDPADTADMARVMARLLGDAGWREELAKQARDAAPALSWNAVAHRAEAAVTRTSPQKPSAAKRRPRLALFAPIPPQASGIADYSASLALQMARCYRITWVVERMVDGIPPTVASALEVITAGEFAHRAAGFDQYLYQVGNSDFHLYQMPFLASHPGVVVLHEIGLDGMAWMAEERLPGGIGGMYPAAPGAALRAVLAAEAVRDSAVLRDELLGDALLWRIAASARGLLVHSRHAADLLSGRLSQKPVRASVVPLGCGFPAPPPGIDEKRRLRVRYGLPQDAFIVGTFGIVHPIKGIDLLVESVRMLPQHVRGRLCLLLAGFCDLTDWLNKCTGALDEAGIAWRHTGRLPESDFVAHLRLADLGVSLRLRSRGESSAALLHQMMHGLPSVATDVGSFSEIPDAVLAKVPPQDAKALAGCIAKLAEDTAAHAALAEQAGQWLRQRNWSRVAEAYHAQLQAL